MKKLKTNKKVIAVLSDLHANADALDVALKVICQREVDEIVVLGDLLTYGCQPREVLTRLQEVRLNYDCVFIKGNHDQLYFDLEQRAKPTSKEPFFVKESVAWTRKQIESISLEDLWDWQESYRLETIFFVHANPFQYGNWRYMESAEECLEVAEETQKMGMKVCVFGHTHRKLSKSYRNGKVGSLIGGRIDLNDNDVYMLNPGSIGQPRGGGFSFMILEVDAEEVLVEFVDLDVDIMPSLELINKSDMTQEAKGIIASYLRS